MQEWLNWHAWKACVPQKGTEGSNPSLSAFKAKGEKGIGGSNRRRRRSSRNLTKERLSNPPLSAIEKKV